MKNYAETTLFREPFIFEDFCRGLENLHFEVAIFDMSPGMSTLERSILSAMDEVVTPLTPEYFSLDGIDSFSKELSQINKSYRKKIQHKKIVVNAINQSFRRHKAILDQLDTLDYDIYHVSQDSKIAEAQLYNQSIFEYFPNSKTVTEIARLADSLLEVN